MKFLITQFKEYLEKEEKNNKWDKKSFWASENSGCIRSIYWQWKKEKPSNPMTIETLQILSAGKLIEEQIVNDWTKMGIVIPPPPGYEQHYFKIERNGIIISGKLDALIKETLDDGSKYETPVEIKTYHGDFQERKLLQLQPNEGYIKQLAIGMDALNKNRGILYMINRASGKQFQFTILKQTEEYEIHSHNLTIKDNDKPDIEPTLEFQCGKIKINLDEVYTHFANIYKYVEKNELPPPQYKYKYPINEETIKTFKQYEITAARAGRKVIGDWNCKYCSFKEKCIKEQGEVLGYTENELKLLNKLSKGYTKWRFEKPKVENQIKNN